MSRNLLGKVFIFAAGAAVGSVVTWKLIKTKYEQIAQEEIESVREVYSKDSKPVTEESDEEDDEDNKDFEKAREEYAKIVSSYTEKEEKDVVEPYVISPGEYDENGYDTVSLYYYEDGVLENAITREVIENADELIGTDFAEHFGEFEPDSVYVRNDEIETDFEILRDGGYYSEVE